MLSRLSTRQHAQQQQQQPQETVSPEEALRRRLLSDVDGLQKEMDSLAQQVDALPCISQYRCVLPATDSSSP